MIPNGIQRNTKYKKKMWTKEEDDQLVKLVNEHGTSNWVIIAQFMENRTGKQCRERWLNRHNPGIKNTQWTEEEDRILIEKQKEFGNSWVKIAAFIEGRSSDMIKTRFSWLKHKNSNSKYQMQYKTTPPIQNEAQTTQNQQNLIPQQPTDSSFVMQSTPQLSPLAPSPQSFYPYQSSLHSDAFSPLSPQMPSPLSPKGIQTLPHYQNIPSLPSVPVIDTPPPPPQQQPQLQINTPPIIQQTPISHQNQPSNETLQTNTVSMFQNVISTQPPPLQQQQQQMQQQSNETNEHNEHKKSGACCCNLPSIHEAFPTGEKYGSCYQPNSIFNRTIFNQNMTSEQREADDNPLFSHNDSVFEKRPSNCFWRKI